jgi:transposase
LQAITRKWLGLLIDGSTLLRQVRRRIQPSPVAAPRVLGVDDWAWKKGHRYGNILCDLEAGKIVDLLPDRESATVATWLREHPGTEIVSRDRASAYAEAARRAAPHAVQIADRWHLLHNLSEALRNALEPHRRMMTQAAKASRGSETTAILNAAATPAAPTEALSVQQKNRQRRHSLYEQMRSLTDSGVSQSDIARRLDISLRTVQRWIRVGAFPERTPRFFPNAVDAYAAYLDRRLLEGCRNVSQLWRELRQQGYRGKHSSVWHWLRQHREHGKKTSGSMPMKSTSRTSPQHTAWQILKGTPSAQTYLEELYRCSPEIARLAHLGREFFRIVRKRDLGAWPQWLEAARLTTLRGFVSGLTRDQEAVQAALSLPWSNGPVEGHVHRLKLIKRQMYGRASFDLLRLRVLQNA